MGRYGRRLVGGTPTTALALPLGALKGDALLCEDSTCPRCVQAVTPPGVGAPVYLRLRYVGERLALVAVAEVLPALVGVAGLAGERHWGPRVRVVVCRLDTAPEVAWPAEGPQIVATVPATL